MGTADHVRVRNVTILRETDTGTAVLIEDEQGGEHWLPMSQVSRMTKSKAKGGDEVWIPRWLAEKKELEHD